MKRARRWCFSLLVLSVLSNACTGARGEGQGSVAREDGSSSPLIAPSPTEAANAVCANSEEWCEVALDSVPSALGRPLKFPKVAQEGVCRANPGHEYENSQFGGYALGNAPLQPLIAINAPQDAAAVKRGVLRFRPSPSERGWHQIKTLWFAWPRYQGPALIRARQLDGTNPVRFGESPSLTDPYLSAGPTENGEDGFREWPGATWIRAPGCYAWQVDGLDFSYVIVFKAQFEN
jgi:hypothetical protein